ncbi:MAG: FAD binding domain-containing protein [Candidatus Riflebacteria bacterium]|nr:FAD binding domain-containing protein [Candidatus Riflebacteria bacterium]
MLAHVARFYHPTTVEEACSLLAAKDHKNVALAGGTHLAVVEDSGIEGLVDLKGLKLTHQRRENGRITIGAMNPVEDLKTSTLLSGPGGNLLRLSAAAIGSTPLRHAITVGGNLVAAFPWSDLPPALLALDTEVVLRRGKEERVLPIGKLYETRPTDVIKADELVTEIRVSEFATSTGTAFQKVARTKNDYALITVAVRLTLKDGLISEARVALNGLTRRPCRITSVETFLTGKKCDKDIFREAAKKAGDGIELTSDFRASREYREEVLPVYIRRCLEEAAANVSK